MEFSSPQFDGRVLVVEDEEVNRFVARGIMSTLGIEPDFAENGAEALEKIAACRYDLIFMDVQMPEMNGIEATVLIREHERAAGHTSTPIVALTAFAATGDRTRCLAAGMNDYISKPLLRDALIASFERWLGGQGGRAEQQPDGEVQIPPHAMAPGPLDATRFAVLVQSMQSVPGGLRSVLESYLESLDRLPAAILKAVQDEDAQALTRAAHSLKSNSAAAGALELSVFSEDLEKIARKGRTAENEKLLLQIKNEITRVRLAIQVELNAVPR